MSTRIIDKLYPVKELPTLKRERLVQEGSIILADQDQEFLARDEQTWFLYLLKGSVTLIEDGEPLLISADSPRAQYPLFSDAKDAEDYVLVLANQTQLLRLDRELYATLKQEDETQTEPGQDSTEITEAERDIFAGVYKAYQAGKLELPVLPEMAIKIKEMVNDPNIDANQLARLIQVDMATTAALMRTSNSGMYAGLNRINSVRDAIVRLGLETTRNMVFSVAMRHVFKSNFELFKRRMQKLWESSVHISALSYVIARHCEDFDSERAMLAGLLCDIGELPIIGYLEQIKAQPTPDELDAIINKLKTDVGKMIAAHWGLDTDIALVIRESTKWQRETEDGLADYCDIVLVARLYYEFQTKGESETTPRYDEVPAFTRLGLAQPNEALKLDIIEESEEELKAAMDLLKGKAKIPENETGSSVETRPDAPQKDKPDSSAAASETAKKQANSTARPQVVRGVVQRLFKTLSEAQDFRLLLEQETGYSYNITETPNGFVIRRAKISIKSAENEDYKPLNMSPAKRREATGGLLFSPSWAMTWPFAFSAATGFGLAAIGALTAHLVSVGTSSALIATFSPVLSPVFVMMGTALVLFSIIGSIITRHSRNYLVSHEGLEIIDGILSYNVHHIPLDNVDSIDVQQSEFERMLGIGNLEFGNITKKREVVFTGLANPFECMERISQYLNLDVEGSDDPLLAEIPSEPESESEPTQSSDTDTTKVKDDAAASTAKDKKSKSSIPMAADKGKKVALKTDADKKEKSPTSARTEETN